MLFLTEAAALENMKKTCSDDTNGKWWSEFTGRVGLYLCQTSPELSKLLSRTSGDPDPCWAAFTEILVTTHPRPCSSFIILKNRIKTLIYFNPMEKEPKQQEIMKQKGEPYMLRGSSSSIMSRKVLKSQKRILFRNSWSSIFSEHFLLRTCLLLSLWEIKRVWLDTDNLLNKDMHEVYLRIRSHFKVWKISNGDMGDSAKRWDVWLYIIRTGIQSHRSIRTWLTPKQSSTHILINVC